MVEPRQYNPDDIESLDDRGRKVLIVVAEQTGHITPNATESEDTDTTPDSDGDVSIATTSSIRDATGLSNAEVNYQLRKLGGGYDFSVSEPLTNSVQQGTDAEGRQRPKRIELTAAGERAVSDGVVTRDTLDAGPDWFPETGGVDEKLDAIADRVAAQEVVLDELTRTMGFTSASALVDSVENSAVTDDVVATPGTPVGEYSVLETIARVSQGQKALVKALEENGGDPKKHLDR